jgi:hypothetical protein
MFIHLIIFIAKISNPTIKFLMGTFLALGTVGFTFMFIRSIAKGLGFLAFVYLLLALLSFFLFNMLGNQEDED